MNYFLIECSDNGIYIKYFENNHELEKYLNEYYTDYEVKFYDKLPKSFSVKDCGLNGLILIEGQMILPKAANVIKEYFIN